MKGTVPALLWLLASAFPGLAYSAEFERAAVRIEQNATDEDVEVVFEVTSGDTGMSTLRVSAPDGRTVVDFKAPDSKLGIRHLVLESPEPVNDGRLQKDFPAGVYTFTGTMVTGEKLSGKATLSHKLPDPASIVRPRHKERNVPVAGLQVRWTAPKGLAACLVILEDEETGIKVIQATLPGAATTFPVPNGVLKPGTKYKVEIGTITPEGNRTIVEAPFMTAGTAAKK
jgi:hypothetical protein